MADDATPMTRESRRTRSAAAAPVLAFGRADPERRLGLPTGRFTNPSAASSLLLALLMLAVVYGGLAPLRERPGFDVAWTYLTGFSGIPIPMAFLAAWATSMLLLKRLKISAQRRALRLRFLPTDAAFTLSSATAERVIEAIETSVDEPERFMYLQRVLRALKSVRNVGRVGDIDEMLSSRAEQDEIVVDGGYTLVRGFVWAIPVLGFIGTIVGLTAAIGRFGTVLSEPGMPLEEITAGLTDVIGGLDTAFVTTGEGLVAALLIHLLQVFVRREDETFLDEVREACTNEVVARVRLISAPQA
ncbi:MAG: MotA/TolQ/ExbB proton channel family protein [Phycisphaerales bacterium]|jgi:hypothetical protein